MNILQPFLEITLFLLVIFACFYFPGKLLLSKLKLNLGSPEDLFLPFVLGIILFTLISYILSWLKLELLILPLFLIISFFVLKSNKWFFIGVHKSHRLPLLAVVVLSIVFGFSMLTTGIYGDTIIYRKDDLWHLALINELKANFPPDNPGFAGIPLRGYHFFYNFILAKLSNIFSISPLALYFHLFPLFVAILWGLGVYALIYKWSKKVSVALWAVFLTQFGGSFAFILRFRGHEGLSLDSAFGIQQPISSLINPPFAISIVIVIAVLFALYQYFSTLEKGWLVPVILCIGIVTMFKVYAGIILLVSFLFLTLLELLKKKFIFLVACFFIGILFLGTYGIFRDTSSTLIFAPLWAPHGVLVDNMPWYGYAEKMYTYTKLSVIKGIVETELYSWYIFIFGNLGTRLMGLLFLALFFLKKRRKYSYFVFALSVMTLVSILIPLFFIQSGKVFEIIQMAWYFLFFVSLFAAFGFYKLFSFSYSKVFKIAIFIIILVLTLPSAYDNYRVYFASLDSSRGFLSDSYFQAMKFLKSEGDYDQTVVEIPEKSISATKSDLMRWYRSSTPKIVAFGNKRSYLSNEYIDFANLDIVPRIDFVRKIIILNSMEKNSPEYEDLQREIKQKLKENKIVFIYSPHPLSFVTGTDYIRKVFENQAANIYKVDWK